MSLVRRCDNPACVNGPGKTPAVAGTGNPDGWITAQSSAIVGGQPEALDFDTPLCAAQALYGADVDVAEKGTTTVKTDPPVKP